MKKFMSILCVMLMAVGLMVPMMASAECADPYDTMYVVTANGKTLNVRELPNKNSRILYRVENGSSLTILHDEETPVGWAEVRQGNKTVGFVMDKFLQSKKPYKYDLTERDDDFRSVASYTVMAKPRTSRTEESVGLRVKPTKQSAAIRRLMAGDTLQVVAVGKTWSRVYDPQTGATGYVANDYIVRV